MSNEELTLPRAPTFEPNENLSSLSLSLGVFKLSSEAVVPAMATPGSACFDIHACLLPTDLIKYFGNDNGETKVSVGPLQEFTIFPQQRALIPTGLILNIPEGYSVRLHPRSGLALKSGLILANCEGVIDSDYIDPVFVILLNTSGMPIKIKHGDRICQGELVKSEKHLISTINQKPEKKTSRDGGFGSTGT